MNNLLWVIDKTCGQAVEFQVSISSFLQCTTEFLSLNRQLWKGNKNGAALGQPDSLPTTRGRWDGVQRAIRNPALSESASVSPGRNRLDLLKQCDFVLTLGPFLRFLAISDMQSSCKVLMKNPVFWFACRRPRRLPLGLQWENQENAVGTYAMQRSANRLADFLQQSRNVGSKEDFQTKQHVSGRVLCQMRWAGRWSFDAQNIWELWIPLALSLQISACQHLNTMSVMISNRLWESLTAESVGSETRPWATCYCMLRSAMISRIRKSAAFEYLTCLNIIQGLRDKGPSICFRVSCVTLPSTLVILDRQVLNLNQFQISRIANLAELEIRH